MQRPRDEAPKFTEAEMRELLPKAIEHAASYQGDAQKFAR